MSTWFDRIWPLDPRVWPYLSPNESLLYRWCLHPGLFFNTKLMIFLCTPCHEKVWSQIPCHADAWPMSRWRVTVYIIHNYVHMTREWPCLLTIWSFWLVNDSNRWNQCFTCITLWDFHAEVYCVVKINLRFEGVKEFTNTQNCCARDCICHWLGWAWIVLVKRAALI